MEITEVRVKLTENRSEKLQAFCTLTIDHAFVIRDLKIIGGQLSIHTQAGSGTTIQAVAPLCLAVRQDR